MLFDVETKPGSGTKGAVADAVYPAHIGIRQGPDTKFMACLIASTPAATMADVLVDEEP
jgi:hypothetical protein